MRILIVHRYYYPDVGAYASMLQIMARRFSEQGHQVTVFSTQPGYNNVAQERFPTRVVSQGVEEFRVRIFKEDKQRLLVRMVNVVLFLVQLMGHCLWRYRKYDLITVASFPPTVTAMVVRWMARLSGCKYLYHCQDIYPEIAQTSGVVKRRWLANWSLRIDCRNCRDAAAVVVLSNDMARTLTRRGLPPSNIRVINNFILDQYDPRVELSPDLKKVEGTFRVLFAGNLGRFQNLEQLLAAANELRNETRIHFYFVGAGMLERELRRQAAASGLLDQTVFFHPFQPMEKILQVIHHSDLAMVTLTPGVIDCAYPSKTMTYLEAGCRILAVIEADSELARTIAEHDLGVVSAAPDSQSIAAAIVTEYRRWQTTAIDRQRLRQAGHSLFGQESILVRWDSLLLELAGRN